MLTCSAFNKTLDNNTYRAALLSMSRLSLSSHDFTQQQLRFALGLTEESCQFLLAVLHAMSAPCVVIEGRFFFTTPWFLYEPEVLADSCHMQLQCVEVVWETTSTQDQVKSLCAQTGCPCLVVAEYQTAARGRQGAVWESGFAQNVLFSYGETIPLTPYVTTLSLRVAVALCQALKAFCGDIALQVKWPNDLYLDGKKCAGLLLESETQGQDCAMVVGLGLNVNACLDKMQILPKQEAAYARTALSDHVGCYIDKSRLVPVLVQAIKNAIQQGQNTPLNEDWQRQFAELDALYGQVVTYKQAGVSRQGLACGVNAQGALLLRDADGSEWAVHSGEVCQVRVCRG